MPITGGTPAYLEYLTSTGRTDRVRVPGLGLDDKQRAITRDLVRPRFRQDVNSLRFASGFDESSVVDWILTGSPPTLRPALLKHESFPVTVPGDTTYTSERVIITIQAPHVTEREFRQLYALTRRAWRQARRTHLTAADARLLETMRRQGLPTRPKAEPGYWGRIARASRLGSAEAARVRWIRLEARHPELTRQTTHPG